MQCQSEEVRAVELHLGFRVSGASTPIHHSAKKRRQDNKKGTQLKQEMYRRPQNHHAI